MSSEPLNSPNDIILSEVSPFQDLSGIEEARTEELKSKMNFYSDKDELEQMSFMDILEFFLRVESVTTTLLASEITKGHLLEIISEEEVTLSGLEDTSSIIIPIQLRISHDETYTEGEWSINEYSIEQPTITETITTELIPSEEI